MTFFFPALPSSRLPQSVQKMSEPIADIVVSCRCELARGCDLEKKVTGNREVCGEHFRGCSAKCLRQAVRRVRIVSACAAQRRCYFTALPGTSISYPRTTDE